MSATSIPPHHLPASPSSFIGRDAELAALGAQLRVSRCVTITGAGGAGKTRIAREAAAALLTAPDAGALVPDGVWWVDFAPLRDSDALDEAVAAALGIRALTGRHAHDAVRDAVRDRSLLLVLDNCEHVLDAAASFTARVLASARGVRVLATSRERLAVAGEQVWPLPPLGHPRARDVSTALALAGADAAALLLERIRAVAPTFALDDARAPLVATLCERLDGMPLALELAAAMVPVLGLDGLVARLDSALDVLVATPRAGPARHRTLRDVIEWSVALLDAPARILLARLAVFRGAVTFDAIVAVCTDSAAHARASDDAPLDAGMLPDERAIVSALARLVEQSLVEVLELDRETRYRLLETVRLYSSEQLTASGAGALLRRRHAQWVAALAAGAEDSLNSARRGQRVRALQADLDEIRAALAWATDVGHGDRALALAITGALGWFWISGVSWAEARSTLGRAMALVSASPEHDTQLPHEEQASLARVLYPIQGFAFFDGDTDTMLAAGARTLALWEHVERASAMTPAWQRTASRSRALALQLIGLAHAMRGTADAVEAPMAQSIALPTAVGDAWLAAVMQMRRALARLLVGNLDGAFADYGAAIPQLHALREFWFLSLAYEGAAMVSMARADRACALDSALSSITALEPEPDAWFLSRSLDTLAAILLAGPAAHALPGTGAADDDAELAGTCVMMAEALRRQCGAGVIGPDVARNAATRDTLERRLGAARLAEIGARWTRADVREVFALARSDALQRRRLPAPIDAFREMTTAEAPPHAVGSGPRRLVLCGRFAYDGGAETRPLAGKPRELLCYLALHPHARKEAIGLALWPDASPAQVRNNFHVTLYQVRRALGDADLLVHGREGYALRRAPRAMPVRDGTAVALADVPTEDVWIAIDVDEARATMRAVGAAARDAQRVVDDAALRGWEETLRACSASLLGGDMPAWMEPHDDALRHAWAESMEALVGLWRRAGDDAAALRVATALVAREPLREDVHRQILTLHAARGEPARALAHYRALETLLRDDVGAAPAPATRALLATIVGD